jgi:hypothetical protein
LIVEAIQIHGIDCQYIPRESATNINNILGEQPDTSFTKAFPIEIYLLEPEGFKGGMDEFFSGFGLEMRGKLTINISRRSFNRFIPKAIRHEPTEGDLLWFPTPRRLFELTFVQNDDAIFNSLGRYAPNPILWQIEIEQFKFSQENFSTGIADVDLQEIMNSFTLKLNLGAGSGLYYVGETVYQGNNLNSANASAEVSTWDPSELTLNVLNIKGVINTNTTIVGANSGASYNVTSYSNKESVALDSPSDNQLYDTEANTFIIRTETNPLGGI